MARRQWKEEAIRFGQQVEDHLLYYSAIVSSKDDIIKAKDGIINAKDEAINAKDETIKAKDEIIKSKDETISKLTKEVDLLRSRFNSTNIATSSSGKRCCRTTSSGLRNYAADLDAVAECPFDDRWEKKITSMNQVKEDLYNLVTEQAQNNRTPLCINPHSAAFKSFTTSSVAHPSELPPSPHQWE